MGPITPDDLRFNRFGLSAQESKVLALAMSGRIDKQIATEMGISLGTVRVYWKRIRQKVGGTRSEVIAELARNSLKLNFEEERGRSDKLSKELEESMVRERGLRVYEAAFDKLPTPLAILDGPCGRIVHANEAFSGMHGYDSEELEGLPSSDLMQSGEAGKLEKAALKAVSEGKSLDTDSVRRRKDGSNFDAKITVTGGDGSDVWVLAIGS
ncbi:PAS domain S-box protein [bacterium]|nr:MAG: PAS domain S-box protein [bacterium]